MVPAEPFSVTASSSSLMENYAKILFYQTCLKNTGYLQHNNVNELVCLVKLSIVNHSSLFNEQSPFIFD